MSSKTKQLGSTSFGKLPLPTSRSLGGVGSILARSSTITAATLSPGSSGSFSGDVSIGGTITYEDVTNVDSVVVITARQGIRVGAGQSIGSATGTESVVYYGDGSKLTGVESWNQFDTWLYGGG